jgi:hypothetical protein
VEVAGLVIVLAVWLAVATVLDLDLTGRRRKRPGDRWTHAGGLVPITFLLIIEFAASRDWPSSQRHLVAGIGLLMLVPCFALWLTGTVINIRSRSASGPSHG